MLIWKKEFKKPRQFTGKVGKLSVGHGGYDQKSWDGCLPALSAPTLPMVSALGFVAWTLKTVQRALNKFQGMILRGITGTMRSTPCAAMEVMLGIPPLHLFLKAEAEKTLSRLSLVLGRRITFGDGRRSKKCRELIQPSLQFVAARGIDTIVPKLEFERMFTVVLPQRNDWMEGRVLLELNTIEIYTDGSLMNETASSALSVCLV